MQGRIFSELNNKAEYDLISDELQKASDLGFTDYQLKYSTIGQWDNILSNQEIIYSLTEFAKKCKISISSLNVDISNSANLTDAISESYKMQGLINAFGISDINVAWIEKEINIESSEPLVEELYGFNSLFDSNIRINIESSRGLHELITESYTLPENKYFTLDTGNMTFYGDDPSEILHVIPNNIGQIHLKDRNVSGDSVPFGKGNVDFKSFFNTLNKSVFSGLIVFEGFYYNSNSLNTDNYILNRSYYDFVHNILK